MKGKNKKLQRKVKFKGLTDFGTTCRGHCCCCCCSRGDSAKWSSGRLAGRSNGTRNTTGIWTNPRKCRDSRWKGRRRATCANGTVARTGSPGGRTFACSRTCVTTHTCYYANGAGQKKTFTAFGFRLNNDGKYLFLIKVFIITINNIIDPTHVHRSQWTYCSNG